MICFEPTLDVENLHHLAGFYQKQLSFFVESRVRQSREQVDIKGLA